MDAFIVVTRDKQRLPISRPMHSVRDAGNYIYERKAFARWTVVKQPMDGRFRARGPQQDLSITEKRELERCLYPALFDNGL